MSWSRGLPPTQVQDAASAIDAEQIVAEGEAAAEVEAQFLAAKEAAKSLVKSGALGDSGELNITLSGHATPEHVGDESINVGVIRKA